MMQRANEIILVGGSAGSFDPILAILDALPSTISAAICFVIHRNAKYETRIENSLAQRFNRSIISVMDKMPIEPNHVYFAPPGYHLLVEPDYSLSLDGSESVNYSRPSIDVLFQTAAEIYGTNCTAILLSGANADGAQGISAVLANGGHGIVQTPSDASVDTMPKSAIVLSPSVPQLSTSEIVAYFRNLK